MTARSTVSFRTKALVAGAVHGVAIRQKHPFPTLIILNRRHWERLVVPLEEYM